MALKKIKPNTAWNLARLYTSPKDPKIEKDITAFEKSLDLFSKKYKKIKFQTISIPALKNMLSEYEKIENLPSAKPLLYFHYIHELDSTDNAAEAAMNRIIERYQKAENKILFFELGLGAISPATQKRILKHKDIYPYRYYLEKVFKTAAYNLSESEEKILNLKSGPSSSLWARGVDKLISKQEFVFKNTKLPFQEAMNRISQITNTKDRHALREVIMQRLYDISDFPESEINAIFTNKKINDELRGFTNPYDARFLSDEVEAKTALALIDAVSKSFAISNKFFTLKKKLLGLKKMTVADQAVPIGKVQKKFSFSRAHTLVREAFYTTHERYGHIFDTLFEDGQIDVFPKKGKSGGAYCSHATMMPTFLLLNHTNDARSVETLGHEMGHAMHTERSKQQPSFYQDYSTAVAETASTFFEGITQEKIFTTLSDNEKIIALHDRIEGDIATIFRQVAFFNFELDLHKKVRTEGWVSKEDMALLYSSHMGRFFGPAVALQKNDGYAYIYISHFRQPFYVYTYAFGQLISKALLATYRKDPAYIEEVDTFLSSGGSDSPENIFKKIGIDISNPSFFQAGLDSIANDVRLLEKLTKQSKHS